MLTSAFILLAVAFLAAVVLLYILVENTHRKVRISLMFVSWVMGAILYFAIKYINQ